MIYTTNQVILISANILLKLERNNVIPIDKAMHENRLSNNKNCS